MPASDISPEQLAELTFFFYVQTVHFASKYQSKSVSPEAKISPEFWKHNCTQMITDPEFWKEQLSAQDSDDEHSDCSDPEDLVMEGLADRMSRY